VITCATQNADGPFEGEFGQWFVTPVSRLMAAPPPPPPPLQPTQSHMCSPCCCCALVHSHLACLIMLARLLLQADKVEVWSYRVSLTLIATGESAGSGGWCHAMQPGCCTLAQAPIAVLLLLATTMRSFCHRHRSGAGAAGRRFCPSGVGQRQPACSGWRSGHPRCHHAHSYLHHTHQARAAKPGGPRLPRRRVAGAATPGPAAAPGGLGGGECQVGGVMPQLHVCQEDCSGHYATQILCFAAEKHPALLASPCLPAPAALQWVATHPSSMWFVGPAFAALAGICFKEGVRRGRL